MKKISFFLLILLDIVIFLYLFIENNYLYQILIIHVIIFIIASRINKKFGQEKIELPFYIILFMPIIGPFIYFLFYLSLNYFFRDNEIIGDYEKLIESKLQNTSKNRIEYEKEIKTMSYIDMMSFMDPEKKKEILIDSQYSIKINNANILKKGLESDDKEVQHYSATLLNSKENELTNNISYLRDKYNNTKNDIYLNQLISSYKSYIYSTLIEEDSINIFRGEFIEVLKIKVEKKSYDLETLTDLFKTYIQLYDTDNASKINSKIIREFGESEITKLNELNILYLKGDLQQVKSALFKISEKDLDNCKHYKEIDNCQKLKDLRAFFVEEAN